MRLSFAAHRIVTSIIRKACTALLLMTAALLAAPVSFADIRSAQSIRPAGVTVNYAQVLDWIGDGVFAVGRWDGTISIFRVPAANEFGPMILQAMSTPSGRGIEMLTDIDGKSFMTSDGPDHLAIWARKSSAAPFELVARLAYDGPVGAANSGLAITANGRAYFISGHETGQILIWERQIDSTYKLIKTIDVRSPAPPSNPWGLRNVRALAAWRGDRIISGSEDGDVVGLSLPDGQELFRYRYNDKAQRGINALSLLGERLLLANCAVGSQDKNIWLFDLSQGRPNLLDAGNLALDTGRAQVFNFDVDLISVPGKRGEAPTLTFFSSTEEGLMWQGRADNDQLTVTGVTRISPEGGAVMTVAPGGDFIAVAAFAVRLFKTN
jgi:WD40 repeat protein